MASSTDSFKGKEKENEVWDVTFVYLLWLPTLLQEIPLFIYGCLHDPPFYPIFHGFFPQWRLKYFETFEWEKELHDCLLVKAIIFARGMHKSNHALTCVANGCNFCGMVSSCLHVMHWYASIKDTKTLFDLVQMIILFLFCYFVLSYKCLPMS